MDAWVWVVIALVVLAVVAFLAWSAAKRRQTGKLREGFGPEYERTVAERGDRRSAERELEERQKLREELEIHPLPPSTREHYGGEWRAVQGRFVDDPAGAVGEADRLVTQVMRDRGYPMEDFERQAALVSVDHPDVVQNYRAGHAIYLAHSRGDASTEDLRQAMVHYRALFDELLDVEGASDDRHVRKVH